MRKLSMTGHWPLEYTPALAWPRVARRVTAWARATADRIAANRRQVRMLKGLLMLDDRMLADIGLGRGQVDFALRRGARRGAHLRRAITTR